MMQSLDSLKEKFSREDGHFELSQPAAPELIKGIETGEMTDVVPVFRERAYEEAEDEVRKAVDEAAEENVREAVKTAVTENVREQVRAAILAAVTGAVDEQLSAAAAMGMEVTDEQRAAAIDEAYQAALAENYDAAEKEALEAAFASEDYEKAVADAINEARESEDYKTAFSEAMDEAKKEIDKKIDEEYDDLSERYSLNEKADPVPVKIYELFFRECAETLPADPEYKGEVRVFNERTEVDLYDILEGRAPANENEIVIDRMHADNAGIKTGDTFRAGKAEFTVVGLVSFVDFTTLYRSNTDTMFDALTFDAAMVTREGFERISEPVHANYAFIYDEQPADEYEEKRMSDAFLKALITHTVIAEDAPEIEDYVPAYANHAITFAPEDMGSDEAMGGVLLYILVAVLAFIFAVTASAKLEKEASVIGTLRASGYTKGELLRYYMSGTIIVIIAAAIVGNILGYTLLKNVVVAMYYNSYSLPTYETIWSPDAFVQTTVMPVILMLVINLAVITRTLRLPPLRFLRHDLKRTKRSKAIRLPGWRFFARFRMRVFLQNIPNYIMMFVGIVFVMLLLSMAVGMPETLKYFQGSMSDMMFAEEQVVLYSTEDEDGNTITTGTQGAERFSMYSLMHRSDILDEEISIYGIENGSRYVTLPDASGIYVSKAYSDKYGVKPGDTITLSEKYESREYSWKVDGVYDYSAALTVFMSNDRFNTEFGRKAGEFSGYMSDEHISDIDSDYIAKVITSDDIKRMADQLDHSMGAYMTYFQYVCVIVAVILLYLLTKIIVEKNERAISMVKILGYTDREISSLYIVTTGIVVFVTEFAAVYLGYKLMGVVWKMILMKLGGWFDFVMPMSGFVREYVLVFIAYLIITIFDYIRIRRIPKVLALKNLE